MGALLRSVNIWDDVAINTEWSPLKGRGSNFQTHKLVEIDYNRLEFKSTLVEKIFSLIFLGVGLAVPMFFGLNMIEETGDLFTSDFLFILLFGLIFASV